jgi:hypothetical protein
MGRGLRACLREVSSDFFHFAKISYSLFHAEFWPDYEDASSNLASILRVSLAFKLRLLGKTWRTLHQVSLRRIAQVHTSCSQSLGWEGIEVVNGPWQDSESRP